MNRPSAAPPSFPPRTGLDAAQRAALSSFLQSPAVHGRAMDLHMIQGLAAALALGPRVISPSLWLAWVWDREQGVQAPVFADIDEANAVMAQVMVLYNEAAARLGPAAADEDVPAYAPLFTQAGAPAAAHFCAGFRRAVALAPDDWEPLWAESPQWRELLEGPAPDGAAVLALLAPLRRYWRSRGDRLEPLHAGDLLGRLRKAFEFFRRPFPRDAVALAERHRDVVAPWLVQVLDDVARDPTRAADDYVLHHFAMVLLGHWRDTRAYRPLLALARLPHGMLEAVFGDLLHETYNRAVASVCDGDLAPLAQIVDDDAADVWVRMALIEAWTLRVIEGDAPAAPLEDSLLAIGERDAARLRRSDGIDGDEPDIIEAVAGAACDIASERLRTPVLGWFDDGLIDPRSIDRAWFEREMAVPLARRRADQRARGRSYLRDAEAEIGWWSGYHDEPARTQRDAPSAGTIVRDAPKIGRNDPCPCGSGRKYKKCHGAT